MSKRNNTPHLSRRALLQGVLGGAATYALWPIRPLLAQDAAGHRFVAERSTDDKWIFGREFVPVDATG